MRLDRAELAGTGAAIAFHAALIAALSLSLARVSRPPEPPAMEVELVDEAGLRAAAPTPVTAPPPASEAPEPSPPPPAPVVQSAPPPPQPSIVPVPAPLPRPAPVRPPPQQPRTLPTPAKPHASRIGADFLKGIADAPSAPAPARASAPAISASAMAGIQQAIRRQVQPCADRQINPGPGASKIKVKLHLVLNRAGALSRPPEVVATTGVDEDNARYEERVKDLAVAIISGCAPLGGLPQELYQTPSGGWSNFNMIYSLP